MLTVCSILLGYFCAQIKEAKESVKVAQEQKDILSDETAELKVRNSYLSIMKAKTSVN